MLELANGDDGPVPLEVPLDAAAADHMVGIGRQFQELRETTAALTRSAIGKARGLALLKGEPGSPEFIESYRRATEERKTEERTTEALIDDYFDSGHFLHHLAPRTQEDYRKLGARFRAKFGATPLRFAASRVSTSPTCGERLLRAWRSPAARSRKSAPSAATAMTRRTPSCRRTTSTVTRRSFGMPSRSWRHSRPE
jgi:hypothetical protein